MGRNRAQTGTPGGLDAAGAPRLLECVETPDGELALRRRPGEHGEPVFELILDGVFLMCSEEPTSERLLARVALAPLAAAAAPRVLVGGLGMGFTLQAALELLPATARVTVAELHEAVARWCEQWLGCLNGHAARDPRVRLVAGPAGDVRGFIAAAADGAAQRLDAVLLDVDNGPGWLAREENRALYDSPGLDRLRAALVPGGVAGIWAARPEPAFAAELRLRFGAFEEHRVPRARGPADVVYVAQTSV